MGPVARPVENQTFLVSTMFSLRAVRSLRAALPKNNQIILPKTASRALSTSQRVFSERPPTLYGDGAKAGEVPSDLQQATGMERLQLLGQMEGIDVFNTGPLMMSKKGTLEDPTIVPSYVSGLFIEHSTCLRANLTLSRLRNVSLVVPVGLSNPMT